MYLKKLKSMFKYLTWWNLVLVILYNLGFIQYLYFDILFLSVFISIMTIYIVYVYPKKIVKKVGDKTYELEGDDLIKSDLLMHHLPLLIMLLRKGPIKKTYLFIILPILYNIFFKGVLERYLVNEQLIFVVYFPLLILYLSAEV